LNLRPSGYEPDELPDCSTPHRKNRALYLVPQLMQAWGLGSAPCPIRRSAHYCKAR
jgi:hypothetical protein